MMEKLESLINRFGIERDPELLKDILFMIVRNIEAIADRLDELENIEIQNKE